MKKFEYQVGVEWTGNDGTGTSTKRFGRDNEIATLNKPTIVGSAPPEFGGDGRNWAPEDLFVAAVSQCHMLTYLFLCSRDGVVVESYRDDAVGTLSVEGAAGGRFTRIDLRPKVAISGGELRAAEALHNEASRSCFIGNSVNCEVIVNGVVTSAF